MLTPRIVLHGGAGPITHENLPQPEADEHRSALLRIVRSGRLMFEQNPHIDALTVACDVVTLLEQDTHFNSGRGAVFTRAGTIELEASIMVSSPTTHLQSRGSPDSVSSHSKLLRKRGAAVMGISHIKSPIQLAKQVLLHSTEDVGNPHGSGARTHVQLHGETVEDLGRQWGLETCDENYFWTEKSWNEHIRELEKEHNNDNTAAAVSKASESYVPQGTVGCVVMDSRGNIAAATSTGGITNKLPGRIGDTPTFGAGFWAEEWDDEEAEAVETFPASISRWLGYFTPPVIQTLASKAFASLRALSSSSPYLLHYMRPALLGLRGRRRTDGIYLEDGHREKQATQPRTTSRTHRHAVGMSGTGSGDSFLQLSATRTAAAYARFANPSTGAGTGVRTGTRRSSKHGSLQHAITTVAGPHGDLQRFAGDRWGVTLEGQGGIIGIERVNGEGTIAFDFNCAGMFRAWIDDSGREQVGIFPEDPVVA